MTDINNEMNVAPKKNGLKYGVIAVVVLIALGLVYAFASGMFSSRTPKDIAFDAISNLVNDKSNPLDGEFGIVEMQEKMIKQNAISGKIAVESVDGIPFLSMLRGVFVDFSASNNGTNSLVEYGVGYGSNRLVNLIVQNEDQKVALAIPKLLDKALEADLSGDLKAKVEASPMFNDMIDSVSGFDADTFINALSQMSSSANVSKYQNMGEYINNHKGLNDAWKALKDSATVTETDAEDAAYNGGTVKAKRYTIVFEKENVIKFFETLRDIAFDDEEFKINVTDLLMLNVNLQAQMKGENFDLDELKAKITEAIEEYRNSEFGVPTIAVETTADKDAKLTKFEISQEIEGKPLTFTVYVKGGNTQTENVDVAFTYDTAEVIVVKSGAWDGNLYTTDLLISLNDKKENHNFTITVASDYDKESKRSEANVKVSQSDMELFGIDVSGIYEDIVKGSGFNFVFDKLQVSVSGVPYAVLSGNLKLSADSVNVVSEELNALEKLDIFTMTQEQADALIEQFQMKVNELQNSILGAMN